MEATISAPEQPKKKSGWGSFIVIILAGAFAFYLYDIYQGNVEVAKEVKQDSSVVAVVPVLDSTKAVKDTVK